MTRPRSPDHAAAARVAVAVLPPLVTALCLGWLISTGAWSAWGIERMEPKAGGLTSFADLSNITATADCLRGGTDVTACDPYGRPFQPYVVAPARLLSRLGLGLGDTRALGVLLAALYVTAIALLAGVLVWRWAGGSTTLAAAALALSVAAVSPPAMLMVERGQVEAIGLLLTVIALLALSARSRLWGAVGAIAAMLAVGTKYFPVGLFLPFLGSGRRRPLAVTAFVASTLWLLTSLPEVRQAMSASRSNEPVTTRSSFGSPVLLSTWFSSEPLPYRLDAPLLERWNVYRACGIGLLVLIAALSVLPAARDPSIDSAPALGANLVLGGSGVLLAPFLVGASHDYRLVFLLPVLVGALLWWGPYPGWRGFRPAVMAIAALLALVTGAPMMTTSWGFHWPKGVLLLGDMSITVVLGASLAAWIEACLWPHRSELIAVPEYPSDPVGQGRQRRAEPEDVEVVERESNHRAAKAAPAERQSSAVPSGTGQGPCSRRA